MLLPLNASHQQFDESLSLQLCGYSKKYFNLFHNLFQTVFNKFQMILIDEQLRIFKDNCFVFPQHSEDEFEIIQFFHLIEGL